MATNSPPYKYTFDILFMTKPLSLWKKLFVELVNTKKEEAEIIKAT
jgi:hypothetical protein